MTSTITSKGQITLPKKIRDILNLHPGNKVEFILDGKGRVRMVPMKSSITELRGIAPKPDKIISLEQMQKSIEEGIEK